MNWRFWASNASTWSLQVLHKNERSRFWSPHNRIVSHRIVVGLNVQTFQGPKDAWCLPKVELAWFAYTSCHASRCLKKRPVHLESSGRPSSARPPNSRHRQQSTTQDEGYVWPCQTSTTTHVPSMYDCWETSTHLDKHKIQIENFSQQIISTQCLKNYGPHTAILLVGS